MPKKLKFKLGKVIKYAYQDERRIEEALKLFFEGKVIYPEMENYENIEGLFNEWLIFEFKTKSQPIAVDYYFRNPDNLSEELMNELKQILETQFFGILEIIDIKRGEWLKAHALSPAKLTKFMKKWVR